MDISNQSTLTVCVLAKKAFKRLLTLTQSSTHRACHVVKELLLLHVDNKDWERRGVPWQSVFAEV